MRVEEIQILAAEVLVPPPDLTVSEWADLNRRLSSESAAEKGEWRTDRAPYQRAIMDALSPAHPAETVVVMSAPNLERAVSWRTSSATSSISIRGRYFGRAARSGCRGFLEGPSRSDAQGHAVSARQSGRLPKPGCEQHHPAQEIPRRQHHFGGSELAGRPGHAVDSLLPPR